jgi:O-antigen/teichoic acid export membrane protein
MLELSPGSVSIPPRMSLLPAITSWLQRNRTSARMAFLWRMIAMALGSLFSLLWWRLLLRAMGDPLMGLYQLFQSVTRLGGLGDFGITSALGLKVGTLLGRGDEKGLKSMLASARTLFIFLAAGLCLLLIALSPWLPNWLGFASVPEAGSMTWLFVFGGISLAMIIVSGYFASLNYAHGTVTWPIFPTVLFAQVLAPFVHWRLALLHLPLWIQLLPYLGSSVIMAFLGWRMLKWSHPWLGNLRPLKQDRAEWKALTGTSWWAYLVSLGATIYLSSDVLVIGAEFGPGAIPRYRVNYRVCELFITLIVTASFVGIPKLTQWIASPQEGDRRRLLAEMDRLSKFEIALTCISVLGYLAFNNLFIRLWLDEAHQAPLAWQVAFACNLAVTCSGNAGIQMSMRAGNQGLKWAGLVVAGTGLLNLTLSIISVKLGSIGGVAVATVIAQSVSSILLGGVTCRYLGLSVGRWTARCWLLPMGFVLFAAGLKVLLPDNSLMHLSMLSACYFGVFLVVCVIAGVNRELIRTELNYVRAMFRRNR